MKVVSSLKRLLLVWIIIFPTTLCSIANADSLAPLSDNLPAKELVQKKIVKPLKVAEQVKTARPDRKEKVTLPNKPSISIALAQQEGA